jgi:hypothetical protein
MKIFRKSKELAEYVVAPPLSTLPVRYWYTKDNNAKITTVSSEGLSMDALFIVLRMMINSKKILHLVAVLADFQQ